jgi:hypothetical protein
MNGGCQQKKKGEGENAGEITAFFAQIIDCHNIK